MNPSEVWSLESRAKVLRLFVAITLPADVKTALGEVQRELKQVLSATFRNSWDRRWEVSLIFVARDNGAKE